MIENVKIKKYRDNGLEETNDIVVVEKNMVVILNSHTPISIAISPAELEAFTYGFLYTSGFIGHKKHIKKIQIDRDTIQVDLDPQKNLDQILSLGSSGGRLLDSESQNPHFSQKVIPEVKPLLALFEEFSQKSVIFAQTGGVHSAAISDGIKICYFSEDIGRHNAVDKVMGKGLLAEIDFSNHILCLSGRISNEMVKKTFNAGIPTIVSRAAPTSLAIEQAKKMGMTLIGFLRGNRFNIYT